MSSYQFALIDNKTAYLGIGLQRIVRSWSELEHWFHSSAASHQIAIGYIGYEQQIYFGIFRSMQKISIKQLTDESSFTLSPLHGESFKKYNQNLKIIKKHLSVGDIYQANYCYRLSAKTTATPNQLLFHFTQKQPTPYSALIHTPDVKVVSNSPELGVSIHGSVIECRPMKGTLPKREPKQKLLRSKKDQAELDMITDVVRNDLAQVAVPGSVRVVRRRQLVGFSTVWQTQAVVQAKRSKKTDILTVIKTMLPFASVTGAPKLRAVEILKELEKYPRGVYCGAIGYIAGRNQAEFNVAIRTATLHSGTLHYYVGGGITFDSDAQSEYEETLTKAILLNL